jgi:hypothetical protein
MPSILLIEKNASIKLHTIKVFSHDDLFKKAGFKTNEGFGRRTSWTVASNTTIELYGKTNGRAGQENKYDFPPPVDATLFFGACVLVQFRNGEAINLTVAEWETIYEKLFGGFDDIGSQDSDDEDDQGVAESEGRSKSAIFGRDAVSYENDSISSGDMDECSGEFTTASPTQSAIFKELRSPKDAANPQFSGETKSRTKITKGTFGLRNANSYENVVYPEENQPGLDKDIYLGCTDELQEEDYV